MNKKEFIEELNQAKEDVYKSYICSLEAELIGLSEDNAEYKRINESLTRQLRDKNTEDPTHKTLDELIQADDIQDRNIAISNALQYVQEAVRKGVDLDFLIEQAEEIKEFEDRNG